VGRFGSSITAGGLTKNAQKAKIKFPKRCKYYFLTAKKTGGGNFLKGQILETKILNISAEKSKIKCLPDNSEKKCNFSKKNNTSNISLTIFFYLIIH